MLYLLKQNVFADLIRELSKLITLVKTTSEVLLRRLENMRIALEFRRSERYYFNYYQLFVWKKYQFMIKTIIYIFLFKKVRVCIFANLV